MTIQEVKELCNKLHPNKCKQCPFYVNDCENYEKGGKWENMERVLPKDWDV